MDVLEDIADDQDEGLGFLKSLLNNGAARTVSQQASNQHKRAPFTSLTNSTSATASRKQPKTFQRPQSRQPNPSACSTSPTAPTSAAATLPAMPAMVPHMLPPSKQQPQHAARPRLAPSSVLKQQLDALETSKCLKPSATNCRTRYALPLLPTAATAGAAGAAATSSKVAPAGPALMTEPQQSPAVASRQPPAANHLCRTAKPVVRAALPATAANNQPQHLPASRQAQQHVLAADGTQGTSGGQAEKQLAQAGFTLTVNLFSTAAAATTEAADASCLAQHGLLGMQPKRSDAGFKLLPLGAPATPHHSSITSLQQQEAPESCLGATAGPGKQLQLPRRNLSISKGRCLQQQQQQQQQRQLGEQLQLSSSGTTPVGKLATAAAHDGAAKPLLLPALPAGVHEPALVPVTVADRASRRKLTQDAAAAAMLHGRVADVWLPAAEGHADAAGHATSSGAAPTSAQLEHMTQQKQQKQQQQQQQQQRQQHHYHQSLCCASGPVAATESVGKQQEEEQEQKEDCCDEDGDVLADEEEQELQGSSSSEADEPAADSGSNWSSASMGGGDSSGSSQGFDSSDASYETGHRSSSRRASEAQRAAKKKAVRFQLSEDDPALPGQAARRAAAAAAAAAGYRVVPERRPVPKQQQQQQQQRHVAHQVHLDARPGEVMLYMSAAAVRASKQRQQQQVLLVELPAGFDAAGDSGAIGRIICNRDTTGAGPEAGLVSGAGAVAARLASRVQEYKTRRPKPGKGRSSCNHASIGEGLRLHDEADEGEDDVDDDDDEGGGSEEGEASETEDSDVEGDAGAGAGSNSDVTGMQIDLKAVVYDTQLIPLAGTVAVVHMTAGGTPKSSSAGKAPSAYIERLFDSSIRATAATTTTAAADAVDGDAEEWLAACCCCSDDEQPDGYGLGGCLGSSAAAAKAAGGSSAKQGKQNRRGRGRGSAAGSRKQAGGAAATTGVRGAGRRPGSRPAAKSRAGRGRGHGRRGDGTGRGGSRGTTAKAYRVDGDGDDHLDNGLVTAAGAGAAAAAASAAAANAAARAVRGAVVAGVKRSSSAAAATAASKKQRRRDPWETDSSQQETDDD